MQDCGLLLLSCPDKPGIVAAVSQFLYVFGATIVHADQFSSHRVSGTFYMRVEFDLPDLPERLEALRAGFSSIAGNYDMNWRISPTAKKKRLAIFASKEDHCLMELLWRRASNELVADIAMVISNHQTLEPLVRSHGIPFHFIPLDADNKAAAEERQLELTVGQVDSIVLARYMRIISPKLISYFPNQIINIHHSFLPAFIGANPYAQAYDRGVKLIGATAHYVTAELDAGPIIEQDVQRVDHRQGTAQLRQMGRHVERLVLARAVSWHVEDRVLLHGNRTVVFA